MQQLTIDFEKRGAQLVSNVTDLAELVERATGSIERRAFNTIFKRAEGSGRLVEGYAAVFNSPTDINGWWTEIIEPGAFDDAIKTSDCRALFNHEAEYLLARQSSGTLELSMDAKGLIYRFESPATGIGNDILVMMERGDLKESSFAFTIEDEEWLEEVNADERKVTRRIKKVKQLFDVSPVTFPAYADTTVAKRSFDAWQAKNRPLENEAPAPKTTGHDPALIRAIYG